MVKNIVILMDGTANDICEDRTHVLRLYGILERSERQVVFYDPGVGTFGTRGPFTRFRSQIRILIGLALGAGLDDNVLEAYRFLMETYEEGDRICLFGFSRGAYGVRMLAGLIRCIGLMRQEQLNLLEYGLRAYKRIPDRKPTDTKEQNKKNFQEIRLYQRVLQDRQPRIAFMGVWDTVSSVFETSETGSLMKTRQQPYTNRNDHIAVVRHAIAIDERRTMFQPSLWEKGQCYDPGYSSNRKDMPFKEDQNFKEVWFAGVHCDVGGGYAERDSALSKIPLIWMIDEATKFNIWINKPVYDRLARGIDDPDKVGPNPLAKANNSMDSFWPILEFIPRHFNARSSRTSTRIGNIYIPLMDHRNIPPDAVIHPSVEERLATGSYNPPNLPKNPVFGF